jgi:hypothetical protein
MADPRFASNAIRRRMGAPSSHMGMMDDSDGVGPEMAGFSQNLIDMQDTTPKSVPAFPVQQEMPGTTQQTAQQGSY